MALSDIIRKDLLTIESDLGNQVITWNGQDYVCKSGSGQGQVATLEEGGFSIDADCIITVRKELFTDEIYPKSQQKLVYINRIYRIANVRRNSTDDFLVLHLVDNTRGI